MRRGVIVSLALAIGLLAACTGKSAQHSPAPQASTPGGFPVIVHSGDGDVRIPSQPARILCLSASATQMLYSIGAGSQVVGVDKYSAWPPNAPRTSFTGYESSAEDYLPLHPDLVILAANTGQLVAQLKKLNIPTLLLPPAATIADAEAQITELGQAAGQASGAVSTTAAINRDQARSVESAKGHGKGNTYYIELDQTYYSATSKTFSGALFSAFGMQDIADKASKAGSAYPQLSAEYVLTANPDYVFLADTVCCGQTAKTFASRPGFATLRAVQMHHVIGVNDSVASEWGPHSLESFLTLIAGVLTGGPLPAGTS
ncbi:MAG: ABC transporter substrate-binding protein [Chloroflexota bacterium]